MFQTLRYSRLQLRELTRPASGFDELPLRRQVLVLAEFLLRSGNPGFTNRDLAELFARSRVLDRKTGQPVAPGLAEIDRCMQRWMLDGTLGIVLWRDGHYVVPQETEPS